MSKYFKLRRFTIQCPIDALQVDETKDGDWVHYRDSRDAIKALERQLEEAREFANYKIKHVEQLIEQNNLLMEQLKEARELVEDAISEIVVSSSDESEYTVLELYERLEQLKEQSE